MNRKTLFLALAFAAAIPLAACQSTAITSAPADLTFAQMQPLQISANRLNVINNTPPTGNPRVNPGLALENYANRRLHAVGGDGVLNFIVQQASLVTTEQQPTGEWTEAFQFSKPMEYTVTMRVGLDLAERTNRSNLRSAFTMERKKTLSAGASLAQRDFELNKMIEAMVRDMDQAVQRGLDDSMKILVTPGALTFGKPAPLGSTGAVVVEPGPAIRNPVVIQGSLD